MSLPMICNRFSAAVQRPLFETARSLIILLVTWSLVCQASVPNLPAKPVDVTNSHSVGGQGGPKRRQAAAPQGVDAPLTGLLIDAGERGVVDSSVFIFGPRRFDRTNGAPNKYVEQFALPAGVINPYLLHIQNGEASGDQRVSSAIIKLNGVEVFGANAFNQNVPELNREVTLLGSVNTLEVRLASGPGSFLIINIGGAREPDVNDTTPPALSITSPENNSTTTSSQIDFSGTASDSGTPSSGVANVFVNDQQAVFDNSNWSLPGVALALGANQFTVRAVDGAGNQTSATIQVTRVLPNTAPTVDAGSDQSIALPHTAVMQGAGADDGLPAGSTLTFSWSLVDGPAAVTFSSDNLPNTIATFSTAGSYTLRLTATDGELFASDDVNIIVLPENHSPTSDAGPDQTVNFPGAVSLNGSVSDDALPAGSTLTTNWTQVSGPGVATFFDTNVTVTSVSFSQPGTYVLRLIANDSELTAHDDIQITVVDNRVPPVADFIVPESTGTVGVQVVASSGQAAGTLPDWLLDNNISTIWTTPGLTNQFVKLQLFDSQSAFIDRLRLQSANGVPSSSALKDFEVQISTTTSDDNSFRTVLAATLQNNGRLQEFVLPGGPANARFVKFIPKNNYGGNNIQLATFNLAAVGNADSLLSLPGQQNSARAGSPALIANGGAIYRSSYPGGSASANGLLTYNFNNGWFPALATNPYAVIQLAGERTYTLSGVKLATSYDSGFGSATAVKNFEVWTSSTTPDDASFTKVLTAIAAFNPRLQTFLFPGGPVAARYVKYVPLTNGGGVTINTQVFDVIASEVAQVVAVSGENPNQLNPAEAAFDTDSNSIWYSPNGANTNVWVKTSLTNGQTQKIYGVRITPVNDFTSGQRGPKDFDIRVSNTTTDDAAFATVYSGTLAGTINGNPQEFYFPGFVDAKYVQFFWKNAYSTFIGVRTLEVLTAPANGSVLVGWSSQEEPAANTLDLDPSNQWVTGSNQPANQWLKLLLPGAELATLHHLALRPSIAANGNFSAPKDFELQVSTTDASDTSFVTVLSATLANSNQLQDFYFTPVPARYVRLLLKNSYGGGRFGLASLHLYSADRIGATTRFVDRSTDSDGTIGTWLWDFGDGSSSSEQHPLHTFSAPGDYTVTLTVTDSSGLTSSRQNLYRVAAARRVDFAFSPMIVHEGGESVRFTDTTELLSDANTLRRYDFGDGTTSSQYTNSSVHRFDDSGNFPVTLRVGDPLGVDYSATKEITVLNMTPTVDIDSGKTVVWGEPWTSIPRLDDQSPIDRLSLQGQWSFGDDQTSTCSNCTNANATVTHTYSSPGVYNSSLTITDKDGASASDSAQFIVNKRPVSLTLQPTAQPELGQPLLLRARLFDGFSNQPLSGRSVEFRLNGALATALTDSSGFAEVQIIFAAGAGTNMATASVLEGDLYRAGSTFRLVQGAINQMTCARSSAGTDFWLMFPGNYFSQALSSTEGTFLDISAESATTGTVTISGQNFSKTFSVAAHSTTRVQVNTYHVNSNQIENRGIHVVSQNPVSVYGLNNNPSTVDSFLGLPTAALGNSYLVLGYANGGVLKGTQFGIVAAESATTVTITPSVSVGSRIAGVPYSLALNQGQTYMLRDDLGATSDLSGTLIQSNKPVAVFAGHQCANIPVSSFYCDHLVEQLPPTETWGTHFATLPLATRTKGDTFRFLAANNETHVFLNGSRIATLNAGQFVEKIIEGPAEVASNHPILVAQYSHSHLYDNGLGDPSMILIPPLEHYLKEYTVTSLAGFGPNLINVLAPSTDIGAVTIDGISIPSSSFVPIGSTGMSGAQLNVAVGTHTLVGPHPFAVYVYGFGIDISYGHPGSACLSSTPGPTTLSLAPKTQSATILATSCVTANVRDQLNVPVSSQTVSFSITGAHPQSITTRMTNALGEAEFCYSADTPGNDLITAAHNNTSDNASITWHLPNQAPVVDAGVDQTITLPSTVHLQGSLTDDGLPANILTIAWSKVSGPGNVSFSASGATETLATFDAPGTYILRLTVSDSSLTSSDDVQVIVNPAPVNQIPIVSAGPDQTASMQANLIRNGGNDEVLDNGEITGWTEVEGSAWTQGSSPTGAGFPTPQRGVAYFYSGAAPNAELRQDLDLSAYASSIDAGTQQFEFNAYLRSADETWPDTARVVVEYRDAGNSSVLATLDSGEVISTTGWQLTEDTRTVPIGTRWLRVRLIATRNASAPSDASTDAFFDSVSLRPLGAMGIRLSATAVDDGLPSGSTLSSNWSVVSGPGTVVFADVSSANSGAVFTAPGTYTLRLTASDGNAGAFDEVSITINPANQPPVVNAGANHTITLPGAASLHGNVTDDGQPPASSVSAIWSKVSGPGEVLFGDGTSAVTSAAFSVAGVYLLRLTADDGEYSSSSDVTVNVQSPPVQINQPPFVNPGLNQTISLPVDTVTLNGIATDDGLPAGSTLVVGWTKVSGPGEVVFGSSNNAVTTARFTVAGSYVLRLSAADGVFTTTADVGILVTPANQPPAVEAGVAQPILLSQAVQLNGSVSDDGLPIGSSLTTTWSKVSGPGAVTFGNPNVTITGATFSLPGTYVLRLSASDSALTAYDDVSVDVHDNVAPPAVEITSPIDGAELTEPSVITGSVTSGHWRLEYSLNSDDGSATQSWTEFSSGDGAINGVLGTLDTTLALNGVYSLRLRSTDIYGQTSSTTLAVLIEKNLKIGHFQVAFSDLNVPVAGLPIQVVRSYDSRDKRVGDFGVGWHLGLRSARIEKTGVLGLSWFETVSSGAIPTYCLEPSRPHKVAVTFPDGQVFQFLAAPAIHCQQFVPVTSTQLTFIPEPGTHATLDVVGPDDVLVAAEDGLPGPVKLLNQSNPDIFNAFTYRLTTAEGVSYVIDQQSGVRSVRDPFGNTLEINPSGIVHSSGRSISFIRDAAGRITQITDPNGNSQSYAYDSAGDLISFTDREQNQISFTYNSSHHLVSMTDARGVQLLHNSFDADGRLITQADGLSGSVTYDHNLSARVETITDRLGYATRYEYDERGNVTRQVDAKGNVRTFTYDSLDNLLTETNPSGKTTTYTYDAADNRTSVTDPLGNVTRFTYNGARQPITISDARGGVTTNTYDASGTNLLTSTDALGKTTSYTYNLFTGQRSSMTDALSNVTTYAYEGAGRLERETDALGHVTSFIYDASGNRTGQTVTRTNAAGQLETITTTYVYDKLNRLLRTIFADGSSTLVEYNAIGQQSATIDQLGHRTAMSYDEMGRLTRTDYPDGSHEETTYDAEGRRLTSKDRSGRITSYTYDELGRLTKTTFPDATFTTTTYDAIGQVLTSVDARGNATRSFYDDAGRRTRVRNALGQETTFGFDPNGNQISQSDALGRITIYEFDANNRRVKTTYADASFDLIVYDALGRTTSRTDQAGKTTQFFYDPLGRLTRVKNALNQETTYAYDELGRQTSQTDANNHTTRFAYDQLGRRVRRTLPLGQFETLTYDASGNLLRRTDFSGKTTTFAYDAMRRLLSKTPDASLPQPAVSFTYNTDGQRYSMSDPSGVTNYTYDNRGRLASKQTPFGTLSYTYDEAGNLLSTRSSNAGGTSVDYAYDALNRLALVKDNRLAGAVTSYTYDDVGNLKDFTYPNSVKTSYNYNSLNRLMSMNAGAPALTLASYVYTLGPAGNRTSVAELSGRTVTYTYDDLYRLTSETIAGAGANGTVSYGYDAVGNRLSRASSIPGLHSATSTYDDNDRLTSDNYDANGNTLRSGGRDFDYDFENHLTSLITHDSPLITFTYDGDGNRVGRTAGGVTTNYLIDTNNHTGYAQVVEELQSGGVTKQFTYGHDLISQRCLSVSQNCALSFYGYDGHGSVRYLTDVSGSVTDTYEYDAFGNLISRTGTTSNDYLYSGEQLDSNSGFYYLRARYMNPESGRFATMDTYEGGAYDPTSLHKFTFTENRPTDLVDPSGHFGIGSITGEINALTWRVTIKTWEFQRAIVAGRLLVAALNFASFFGDNESRDIFITLSGGPLNAGIALTQSASVIFGASRSALSAGFATSGGLSRSATVSERAANQLLMNKVGLTLEESSSFTASFDGPVTATIAEPGEQWFRYTGFAGSKGNFLTRASFAQPSQAVDALNLRPWGNPANLRQTVTATGRSIILEGNIKGSIPPGVRQTVIIDREKFQFAVGEKY